MLRRKPSLIAFDLDGTLVDSAPDIAGAVDVMLARLGRPPAGEAAVRGWIGNGAAMLVRRALTGESWPDGDPPDLEAGISVFTEAYAENLCVRTRLYDGAGECLDRLSGGQVRLACITNKPSRLAGALLEQIGISGCFDMIAGGDDFARHKPHPEPLLVAAQRFGIDPAGCLMVGDSPADARAARAAGFALVCVPYGYHGGNGVAVLEPDAIVDSLSDLPPLLDAIPCMGTCGMLMP